MGPRVSNNPKGDLSTSIPFLVCSLTTSTYLPDTRGPILTDEDAKWNYLIEVQLTQGSKVGSLFRYEIAASTVNESKSGKHISLRLMQPDIRLEQIMDSTRLKFLTPKQAFQERINYATENAYRAFTLTVDRRKIICPI